MTSTSVDEYAARMLKAHEFTQVLYDAGMTADVLVDAPAGVWNLACACVSAKYRNGRPVGPPSSATQCLVVQGLRRREGREPPGLPDDPLEGIGTRG